ncbi:MAG: aldolase/citrate lyase family protein [Victivallaceae bacterium]|jgi:4-hydroxy-2-oxoheptanedioate aldolase
MNFIKDKIENQVTRGLFITSGTEFAVELAAHAGFDYLILDMEHGLGDEGDVLRMIRSLNGFETAPIVRIPYLRIEYIKKVLDFGAAGIMCPMVETAADAQNLVDFMRYPPAGKRGLTGSSHASGYGADFKDYFARANANLLCVAQIENANGVENVDAIAAVEGVDVLFIGHSDLSLNLGCLNNFDDKKIIEAELAVLAAARKHGKIAGMMLKSGMNAQNCIDRGFTSLVLGTDIGCLRSAYSKLLNETAPE